MITTAHADRLLKLLEEHNRIASEHLALSREHLEILKRQEISGKAERQRQANMMASMAAQAEELTGIKFPVPPVILKFAIDGQIFQISCDRTRFVRAVAAEAAERLNHKDTTSWQLRLESGDEIPSGFDCGRLADDTLVVFSPRAGVGA